MRRLNQVTLNLTLYLYLSGIIIKTFVFTIFDICKNIFQLAQFSWLHRYLFFKWWSSWMCVSTLQHLIYVLLIRTTILILFNMTVFLCSPKLTLPFCKLHPICMEKLGREICKQIIWLWTFRRRHNLSLNPVRECILN